MTADAPAAGRVVEEGAFADLEFERWFPHPPSRVWRALTDPAELAGWYMTTASLEGAVGGAVRFESGPSRFAVTGRVLAWDPPRLLEHEWNVAPRAELPGGETAVIRWELRAERDGTLLSLTHRRLHRDTALGFAPGTHAFLDRLGAHLDGRPMPNWPERYREVAAQYPASWVARRSGPPPSAAGPRASAAARDAGRS